MKNIKTHFYKFSILLFFHLWSGQILVAQNLFPNPSFENWDGTSGSGGSTLDGLDNWYNAFGTADHHHTSLPGSNLTGLSPSLWDKDLWIVVIL